MKYKTFISRTVCLFLVLASVFALTVVAFAAGEEEYDYSRPNSSYTEVLTSADILEKYLGAPISSEEKNYLDKYGEITLKYDTGITTAYVQTDYDPSGETLTVTAYPYHYVAEGGVEVVFLPKSVELYGDTVSLAFDGEKYIAEFTDVAEDDSLYAEVVFSLDFNLSKEDLNFILNQAYRDAPLWIEKQEEYIAAKDAYEAGILPYENYLSALAEYERQYEDYLSEKKVYDEALAEYEKYLSDLEKYNQAVEDYNSYDKRLEEYAEAYAKYREYLLALEAYEKKLEPYNEYLETLEKVKSQLLAIETSKTPMTMDRTLYSAVMGSLVDSVLENKDLLTSSLAGVSPEVIDLAGDCTERLRELLKGYFSLKTEADKYSYYSVNYEAFRDNFSGLLRALDNLYRNKRVRGVLIAEEKDFKYIILVSQLYIISNALSNTEIYSIDGTYAFDENYTIENRTPLDILENVEYLPDTNSAAPLATGYPAKMEAPAAPESVAEPQKPEVVVIPAYPEAVAEPESIGDAPIAPEVVTEPIMPEYYEHTPEVLGLLSAYEEGKLAEREVALSDYTVEVSQTVEKKIFGVSTVSVIFCDTEGNTLYFTEVDKGTRADFMGEYPTKNADVASVYTFSHWTDGEGKWVNLNAVEDNLVLYPAFSSEPQVYDITFKVLDKTYVVPTAYGDMPVCPVTPEKEDDTLYRYVFSGWDRPLVACEGAATYTAEFESAYLMPLGTDRGATVREEDGFVVADCRGVFLTDFDVSYLIETAKEKRLGITLVTTKGTFTLSYSTVLSMEKNGDTVLTPIYLASTKEGVTTYTYSLSISGNSRINNAYRVSASLPATRVGERMRLSYEKDGAKTYVAYTADKGRIECVLTTGVAYTYAEEYTLTKIPSNLVLFDFEGNCYRPGKRVDLTLDVPQGVTLIKVYLLNSNGDEIEINGGSFIMPNDDCAVGVLAERTEYTVTFVNGFRVIATYTYYYGDTVVLPSDPIKLSDGKYSYTFVGWTPKVDTVTGDVTYTARFDAHLLPPEQEKDGPAISDGVMRILIIAAVVGGVLFAGLVTLVTVIIVKKRKKRKAKENDVENGV